MLFRSLFGMGQIAVGGFAVIHPRRGKQIRAERVPADRGDRPRVRAAALAVPRRGEAVPVTYMVISQCFEQGGYRWFIADIYRWPG